MYSKKFIQDYVYYIKLHEEQSLSTNQRNEFWRRYEEQHNENQ
jgi:hypothetical protein